MAMILAVFGLSSTIWVTAIGVLLVVPLTFLWLISLADTLRRRDLSRREKLFWLVVLLPFPLVGTLVYLYRRPGLREQAQTLRERERERQSFAESRAMAVATLDNFALTAAVAQLSLAQSVELLDEVIRTVSGAESTAGRSFPLTHFRPLGLVEDRLARLTGQLRSLRDNLARMSTALGVNAADLQHLARQIDTLSLFGGDGTAPSNASVPLMVNSDGPADATEGNSNEAPSSLVQRAARK